MARRPRRPRGRLPLRESVPVWLVSAVLSWIVLILTVLYLWSVK